jgi:hypothetical protein
MSENHRLTPFAVHVGIQTSYDKKTGMATIFDQAKGKPLGNTPINTKKEDWRVVLVPNGAGGLSNLWPRSCANSAKSGQYPCWRKQKFRRCVHRRGGGCSSSRTAMTRRRRISVVTIGGSAVPKGKLIIFVSLLLYVSSIVAGEPRQQRIICGPLPRGAKSILDLRVERADLNGSTMYAALRAIEESVSRSTPHNFSFGVRTSRRIVERPWAGASFRGMAPGSAGYIAREEDNALRCNQRLVRSVGLELCVVG